MKTKSQQKIKMRLLSAKEKNKSAGDITGCCSINLNGTINKESGITKSDCTKIAQEFEAPYTFTPGSDCS